MTPNTMPLTTTIKPLGTDRVVFADHDGNIYVNSSNSLKKSADGGNTWTTLNTFSDELVNVQETAEGHLLVLIASGELYRSDANQENFTLVYDELDAVNIYTQHLCVYDNMVFLAECASPPAKVRRIAMSTDFGETWELRASIPLPALQHIHSIQYDPYEGLLWAATGDQPTDRRIWWSDDMASSWQTHAKGSYRATNIMPFPNKVLFGSDERHEAAVYEYERTAKGTSGTDIQITKPWIPKKFIPDTFASTWATIPALKFGSTPEAYFGFRQTQVQSMVPEVWKTDGEKFYLLWKHDHIPNTSPSGILGVWGPDKDNRIFASLRTDIGADTQHLIIISQ